MSTFQLFAAVLAGNIAAEILLSAIGAVIRMRHRPRCEICGGPAKQINARFENGAFHHIRLCKEHAIEAAKIGNGED